MYVYGSTGCENDGLNLTKEGLLSSFSQELFQCTNVWLQPPLVFLGELPSSLLILCYIRAIEGKSNIQLRKQFLMEKCYFKDSLSHYTNLSMLVGL